MVTGSWRSSFDMNHRISILHLMQVGDSSSDSEFFRRSTIRRSLLRGTIPRPFETSVGFGTQAAGSLFLWSQLNLT